MVELKYWIEAFFQIEFLPEMESHWRLEFTCNLKVTGSNEDLAIQLFQLNSEKIIPSSLMTALVVELWIFLTIR